MSDLYQYRYIVLGRQFPQGALTPENGPIFQTLTDDYGTIEEALAEAKEIEAHFWEGRAYGKINGTEAFCILCLDPVTGEVSTGLNNHSLKLELAQRETQS